MLRPDSALSLPMKILVAPDKFKGSLGAREVAENIALGLGDVLPDPKIDILPMADGGEGTAEVIGDALDSHWVIVRRTIRSGARSTRAMAGSRTAN